MTTGTIMQENLKEKFLVLYIYNNIQKNKQIYRKINKIIDIKKDKNYNFIRIKKNK